MEQIEKREKLTYKKINEELPASIKVKLTTNHEGILYEYVSEPKMVDGVVSKKIDDKGNPVDVTAEFTPEDTVHFSAKRNRFWIRKAEVVWYKDEIDKND